MPKEMPIDMPEETPRSADQTCRKADRDHATRRLQPSFPILII